MKKINLILLIISFVLSGIGGIFLFGANATQQSIISGDAPVEEIMEYTYKTYEDYFVDLDFSESNITGNGSKDEPYQIHSTEEFLHLLAGNSKYLKTPKYNIPSEYTQVKYLNSSGTQYIDTGITLSQSVRISLSFSSTTIQQPAGKYGAIYGAVDNANKLCSTAVVSNNVLWASHGIPDGAPSYSISAKKEYTLEFKEEGRWYVNDNIFTETYEQTSTGTSNMTIWLFGRHYDDGSVQLYTAGNLSIYECKFYNESDLIHHYVPCYRNNDVKPGLYDIVTGEFLTNAGTGEFEYGYIDTNISSNLSAKYIELYSDIFLNDETFDKDGNPSGGDGVVYSWKAINSAANCSLNGNGHTIYGLYFYDITKSVVSLFASNLDVVKNLTMKETFIQAKSSVSSVSNEWINNVDNVNTYGHLKGGKAIYGLNANSSYKSMSIKNSNNYANITQLDLGDDTGGNLAGITRVANLDNCNNYGNIKAIEAAYIGGVTNNAGTKVYNCNNYGEIICSGTSKLIGIGGVCGMNQSQGAIIKNCNNYGNLISGSPKYNGGIVGYFYNSTTIENCNNYGKKMMRVAGIAGGGYAGNLYSIRNCKNFADITDSSCFIRSAQNNLIIDNCENYGNIYSTGGYMTGILVNDVNGNNNSVTITNCKAYSSITGTNSSPYFGLIGYVFKGTAFILDNFYCNLTYDINAGVRVFGYCNLRSGNAYIRDSVFNYTIKSTESKSFLLMDICESNCNLTIENVEFNNTYEQNTAMSLFNAYYGTGTFKNIKITETCPGKPTIRGLAWATATQQKLSEDIYSITRVIKTNNENIKMYYGSDFLGFYYSWKLGKIGLVALDGRGQFQGQIDEEWLKNQGYEKKNV